MKMQETEIIGFGDGDGDEEEVVVTKSSKKSGGFQGMGLSPAVLRGILKRGYKIPTPIQRKTIPVALEGRDVVAMARTGSGKTACFLIPLFEKLKARNAKSGARALILSPTRELAVQTQKFIKEIGKFTGLKAAVILGGDSMDNQFSVIHGNPDILVATPGRFLHLCVEMDLSLKNIQMVIFDEADRLFEMGWGEQIHEITNRLPDNRQTLLFSATLPKVLVEFSKAGLSDPTLIRLDVESKLPEQLHLTFITCRKEEKLAVLLCLLKYVIKQEQQVVIFAATQHHVEYIHMILDHNSITNTYIYSNLDASARKINAAKFQAKKSRILIVTDVAARGLDIPHLDNVINFNFPAKSKLFVHRVGRCARAGRSGTAYNIICSEEYPYLLDLHLFLGMKLNILPITGGESSSQGAIGRMPQSMVEQELTELNIIHNAKVDIKNMENVCNNAYQQYLRSRPGASVDSVKRAKILDIAGAGIFTDYGEAAPKVADILQKMKNYRPAGTIFEIGMKTSSVDYKVMKTKRATHKGLIDNYKERETERKETALTSLKPTKESSLDVSSSADIASAFNHVITDRKRKLDDLYRDPKKKKRKTQDSEFYIPYTAADRHTEEGLAVNNFTSAVDNATLDLTADNEDSRRLQTQIKKWDRKKKKMITVNSNSKVGKIRTEAGNWIPATYKTNRYEQWKEKSKIDAQDSDDDNEQDKERWKSLKTAGNTHWARHNQKLKDKLKGRNELKTPEQVLKQRKIQEKKQNRGKKKKKGGGKRKSR